MDCSSALTRSWWWQVSNAISKVRDSRSILIKEEVVLVVFIFFIFIYKKLELNNKYVLLLAKA